MCSLPLAGNDFFNSLLGVDVFAELVVDIDFPNCRLSFSDPAGYSPPPGAIALPLARSGLDRVTDISIEDKPAIKVLVDLGMSGVMELFPDYAQAEGLLTNRSWGLALYSGADGNPEERKRIALTKVSLGETNLANVPVTLPLSLKRGRYPDDVQGYLGVGVLNRYRVILDYSRDRLYLIPNPASMEVPFVRDHFGAELLSDGAEGLLVKLVSPMGPAAKSGLKMGDRVVLINGKPADRQTFAETVGSPIGTKVELTLAGGETRTITLEEFY